MPHNRMTNAIDKFFRAANWNELEEVLSSHPELMSDDCLSILEHLKRESNEDIEADFFKKRIELIRKSSVVGVKEAINEFKYPYLVSIYLSKPDWDSQKEFVKLNQELFDVKSISLIKEIREKEVIKGLERKLDIEEIKLFFDIRIEFLESCRKNGLDPSIEKIEYEGKISKILESIQIAKSDKNIKKEIELYEEGISICKRKNDLLSLSLFQYKLGEILFINKNYGGGNETNIEKAIDVLKSALTSLELEYHEPIWINVISCLANIYEESQNIEKAIEYHNLLLDVYKIDSNPREWGLVQYNLGNLFLVKESGTRSDNIEKSITYYDLALSVIDDKNYPVEWSSIKNNLGNVYAKRILGNPSDNLDESIKHYLESLKIRTKDNEPEKWATTQASLGVAYQELIEGSKLDNLKISIQYFRKALQVFKKDKWPLEWVKLQLDLARSYALLKDSNYAQNLEISIVCIKSVITAHKESIETATNTHTSISIELANCQCTLAELLIQRIRKDQSENIKEAIRNLEESKVVFEKHNQLLDLAKVYYALSMAYFEYQLGNKSKNIEKAIEFARESLRLFVERDVAYHESTLLMNLGALYLKRIEGNRSDNIEQSIDYLRASLEKLNKKEDQVKFATAQSNLGIAFRERQLGVPRENIQIAIQCHRSALKIYSQEKFQYDWAIELLHLGNIFSIKSEGKEEDIKNAIKYYNEAIKILDESGGYKTEWAAIKSNLGITYLARFQDKDIKNIKDIEKSKECFLDALRIRKIDKYPLDWAQDQFNLGKVYSSISDGKNNKNKTKAVEHFELSMRIFQKDKYPFRYCVTCYELAQLYDKCDDNHLAYKFYQSTIEVVESMRNLHEVGEGSKLNLGRMWSQAYTCMIEVCLRLELRSEALEYVERSKSRSLLELLEGSSITPNNVDRLILDKLNYLRSEIRREERNLFTENQRRMNLETINGPNYDIDYQTIPNTKKLFELKEELQELLVNEIYPKDSKFSLLTEITQIKYEDIKSLIDSNTTILEFYMSDSLLYIFLINSCFDEPIIWASTLEDMNNLNEWIALYLNSINEGNENHKSSLSNNLDRLSQIVPFDWLLSQVPSNCTKLIFVPHKIFHIIPLHALKAYSSNTSSDKKYDFIVNLFCEGVSYFPSCRVLQHLTNKSKSILNKLLLIGYNNRNDDFESLPLTVLEAQALSGLFNDSTIINQDLDYIISNEQEPIHCLHFATHAQYAYLSPFDACLKLSADKKLTLIDIFELSFSECQLVTLSACKSGIVDFDNASDEYIGLPSAFIAAGSNNVVSTLWSIEDSVYNKALIFKFYELLLSSKQNIEQDENCCKQMKNNSSHTSISKALSQAQRWLSELTLDEFLSYFNSSIEQHSISYLKDSLSKPEFFVLQDTIRIQREYFQSKFKANEKPFQDPYYWAAFKAIGL